MTEDNIEKNAPGTALFPQFESEIYDMICAEIVCEISAARRWA